MPIFPARQALSSLSRALSSSRACGSSVVGRSSPHHRQQQQLLRLQQPFNPSPYSYSTSPSSSAPPQYRRSEFKVLPFIVLLAIGSGSYILLVKSRTGKRVEKTE